MTQHQKIVALMSLNTDRTWWLPYMFMDQGTEFFVGYEASARLSELANLYPDMIESQQQGKYKARRINWGAIDMWFPNIPEDLQRIVQKYNPEDYNWFVTNLDPPDPQPQGDFSGVSEDPVWGGR